VFEAAPPGRERRVVTLLFADVTGSTALGERLDPERLHDVLEAYFDAMRQEIEGEGGTVEKYIGDAIVAAFGVPAAHEDDPSRALRAALRMQRRLPLVNERLRSDHDVTLEIRIGVNTGGVLAMIEPGPGEPMFTGDAVNVAARFEQNAQPGQIVTSERTARAARAFRYRELGPLDLKGKSVPTRAFVVEGEADQPERGIPGLRAPMVGRDAELALLRSAYEGGAAEGRPHLVTIYGDAGVGKSRLTGEFLAWARARRPEPSIVQGRCLPYGEGVTYWPLAEILKTWAGVRDTDPTTVVVEKIRAGGSQLLTADVAVDPRRATAALAYTVGVEDPTQTFGDLEPRQVREEVHGAWRSFFSALGLRGPVVAVIEDIHWADPALLDLLEELAERVQSGIMFVCPSRPDLTVRRPGWGGGKRTFSSVALDPLSQSDSARLIEHLLAVEELPPTVRDLILERAEGNPFFLEEIIRHLIDEGHIVRAGNRWRAAEGIVNVEIPDTVQGVLAARIDLLELPEKRALQSAAVVGRVFWPPPVRLLLNGERGRLGEILASLESRELVLERLSSAVAGEHEYIFKHILTRDVAYETLPRRERAMAHATVARWIEETAGERTREFVELLAYHYATAVRERADDVPDELRAKAYRSLLEASQDARSRLVVKKAQRMAEEALAFAVDELERSVALEALAQAFLDDYQGDLAWRYFREAADARIASAPQDERRIANLCARAVDVPIRWPGSMRILPLEDDVRRYVEIGLQNLTAGDSEERVRLQTARALWPFGFPDYDMDDETLYEFERTGLDAADAALRLGLPNLASGALDAAASAAASRGIYRRSLEVEMRRLPLVPRLTDSLEAGDAYGAVAWAECEIGHYEEADRLASEGMELMAGKNPNARIHSLAWRTVARHRLGDWDGALRDFHELQGLLDERREDPPYFCSHSFCVAAMIQDARGESVEVDEMLAYLLPLASRDASRLAPWLGRLLVERSALADAHRILDHPPERWRVHTGSLLESRMELVAADLDWNAADPLLSQARSHAAEAGLVALPAFADRLEGRRELAAGDPARAVDLLVAASDRLSELGAVWERARTDLDVAAALAAMGEDLDAHRRIAAATEVFRELGSVKDLRRIAERGGAAGSG
jgi:class 3 adenylate cyclase